MDQHSVYEDQAEKLGIPLSSYVALQLAKAESLPVPDYVQEELRKAEARRAIEAGQGELPLAIAG